MAPTEMAETLPYLVIRDLPRWPMSLAIERRSLRSSSGMFSSAATRNRMLSTPSCVSLSSISRESSSGPISCTVARIGWPCSPNRSQNTVGNEVLDQSSRPISLARLASPSFGSPMAEMPDRSPLMSAAKTGTPAAEKPSAITCRETVLPVPVAPVTRPCRLASLSSRHSGPAALLPRKILPSCISVSLCPMAWLPDPRRLGGYARAFRPDCTRRDAWQCARLHGHRGDNLVAKCRRNNGHWPGPEWATNGTKRANPRRRNEV